jgi:hypothetical protein
MIKRGRPSKANIGQIHYSSNILRLIVRVIILHIFSDKALSRVESQSHGTRLVVQRLSGSCVGLFKQLGDLFMSITSSQL